MAAYEVQSLNDERVEDHEITVNLMITIKLMIFLTLITDLRLRLSGGQPHLQVGVLLLQLGVLLLPLHVLLLKPGVLLLQLHVLLLKPFVTLLQTHVLFVEVRDQGIWRKPVDHGLVPHPLHAFGVLQNAGKNAPRFSVLPERFSVLSNFDVHLFFDNLTPSFYSAVHLVKLKELKCLCCTKIHPQAVNSL